MGILRATLSGIVPPLCAACGRSCRPQAMVCGACAYRLVSATPLQGRGPAGVDWAWSAALYEGVIRELVATLKFRRLLPVADLMAERIQLQVPEDLLSGTIVPVPASSLRHLARGFDPAAEIAAALALRAGRPLKACLSRRGRGRQVGRRRAERIGDPPNIQVGDDVPRSVVLVDDVLTTGATLAACARALRGAGALRVVAITFARRL